MTQVRTSAPIEPEHRNDHVDAARVNLFLLVPLHLMKTFTALSALSLLATTLASDVLDLNKDNFHSVGRGRFALRRAR